MGVLAALALGLVAAAARADERPEPLQAVGIDQKLNEQVPLDLVFRDEQGQPVRLGELLDGKPAILVLAYYRCPMLCNLVLNGLTDALESMSFTAGKEFHVITVSFDSRETPALARAKKATYLKRYARPEAEAGWHFLTGEPDPIRGLTEAVGFRYTFDEKTEQFAHASGIMVLTPEGRLARYFYGVEYSPRDLRLGLVEASENRIGSPVDQVLLFCYGYDPATGKYSASVMKLVRLGGAATVGVLLLFIGWLFWKDARRKRATRSHAPRGNAVRDAPRRDEDARPLRDAERPLLRSHAERGNKDAGYERGSEEK